MKIASIRRWTFPCRLIFIELRRQLKCTTVPPSLALAGSDQYEKRGNTVTIRGKLFAAALLLAIPAAPVLAQEAGDVDAGKKAFRKCMACHRVGEGAKNLVGPILNDVIGRKAGEVEGFRYSPLNVAAGEAGLDWTEEHIFEYLPDPNGYLKKFLTDAGKPDLAKGATRMTFRLKDEKERRDIIAYLQTFSEKK
jgi:cytochrome c